MRLFLLVRLFLVRLFLVEEVLLYIELLGGGCDCCTLSSRLRHVIHIPSTAAIDTQEVVAIGHNNSWLASGH